MLGTMDLALFFAGSLCSRHLNRVQGKEQSLPPGLHQPEEEEDSSATATPHAKEGHARRTPRDTTKAGQEHCCLFIYIRKTKLSSTEKYM